MAHIFQAISKERRGRSDNKIMARRVTGRSMACVLVLAICVWHGAIAGPCLAGGQSLATPEGEEYLPDMNHVRTRAHAGQARAQTQLADFYLASGDFTNAVVWYRRAAAQDHVAAQLSLAGCLTTGRGAEKDPAGAAGLLRRAADLIEGAVKAPTADAGAATPAVPDGSIVISREGLVSQTNDSPSSVVVGTNPPPVVPQPVNSTRIGRVDNLADTIPVLQEALPASSPRSDRR